MSLNKLICPLCHQLGSKKVLRKLQPHFGEQVYLLCHNCDLVWTHPNGHLSVVSEVERYDQHKNDPTDNRYRAFLPPAVDAALPYISEGQSGIDFGCGPGPTLSVMLAELGYQVADFDPIYAPDSKLLTKKYDFVLCTETVEHFRDPKASWDQLMSLVKPAAPLVVMTQSRPPESGLKNWWYLNDPTHIALYSSNTMNWLAANYQKNIISFTPSTTIFI